MIAVPVARFDPEFFRLRSGLAGEITQKFVNYRSKLAVIGDISEKAAESVALRDFVRMQPPQLDLLPARPRRPRRQALRPLTGMLRPRLARAGNPALLSRSSAKFFGILAAGLFTATTACNLPRVLASFKKGLPSPRRGERGRKV